MNSYFSMLLAILLTTCLVFVCADEEKYSSKYDDVNVDEILANDKLRTQYINCFTGKAPCSTPVARYFNEIFAEAYVTKCKKCTDKQMIFLDKVTTWFVENEPDTWETIVQEVYKRIQNKSGKEQ